MTYGFWNRICGGNYSNRLSHRSRLQGIDKGTGYLDSGDLWSGWSSARSSWAVSDA